MTNKANASRQGFGGQLYVLNNDTRLVTYQAGASAGLALKVYTDVGTTNASGGVTFTLPVGYFTTVLSATATVVRGTTDPVGAAFAMLRNYSTTQAQVQVFESKTSGVLLGGVVEGLEATTTAGLLVTFMAFGV